VGGSISGHHAVEIRPTAFGRTALLIGRISRVSDGGEGSRAVRVTFIGHATVLIEQCGVRVLTDPVLRNRIGPLIRTSPLPDLTLGRLDAVLISHLHRDHFDVPTLRGLGRGIRLIVPPGAGHFAHRLGFRTVSELRPGDTEEVGGLTVSAVPAHHDGHRSPLGARAECVGYLTQGSARVYFAGDTALYQEMVDLAPGLDIALLPVWGWGPTLGDGHLGPHEAARALRLLRPRMAIPIHWGTLRPLGMRRLMGSHLSDPPGEFARLAALLTPDVEVRILAPGDALTVNGVQ